MSPIVARRPPVIPSDVRPRQEAVIHPRRHQVSRIERLASFAAAVGVTAGIALLVLAAPGSSFVRAPVAAPAPDARQLSEHVVYVAQLVPAPLPAPMVAATHSPTRSSARTELRLVDPPRARARGPAPPVDSAVIASEAADPRATTTPREATSPSRASGGAPAAGAMVGFRRPSSPPIRFDSAVRVLSESLSTGLATGRLEPPPPTQAERDAKWRAEAFEVVAARGAGGPVRRTMAGGGIGVPLPFGGPSRKQRERDRAIAAQLMAIRALRQQRVDSAVAARARRRADSLARVTDSLRRGTRPQP